jgi:hypothetical protein
VIASFGFALAGGALFGIVTGRLAGLLLARLDEAGPAEITLSVALAYLTYAIAEIFSAFPAWSPWLPQASSSAARVAPIFRATAGPP